MKKNRHIRLQMIQCDCQENIERICKLYVKIIITEKKEEKKYKHLNYIEKTQIENWINNLLRPIFGFKSSLEMAKIVS